MKFHPLPPPLPFHEKQLHLVPMTYVTEGMEGRNEFSCGSYCEELKLTDQYLSLLSVNLRKIV
jgi:hypothetical protein